MAFRLKSQGSSFKMMGSSPVKHGKNSSGNAPHAKFKTETEHEEYHDVNPTKDLNKAEMKEASKKNNTIKAKSQDQIEDEKGVTTNIKMPKVMKDGSKNRVINKGKVIENFQPHQFRKKPPANKQNKNKK